MSYSSSFDAKDRVRQAIDIVDLAGGYLQLRREGRIYKALCPWHDDQRPSLQINPERQSFKCWVCNIGGDVFSFLMKMENVEFPEALAMLAERAGIDLRPPRAAGAPAAPADDKRHLFAAMAWAESLFHECLLHAPEAEPARRYLDGRGLTDESIRRRKLGFAPDSWDWLIKKSLSTKFSPQVLETVGLIGRRQNGPGHYDRFKGRVLFSIRDLQGRPVAFGGRVLPEFPQPNAGKYVNSPETPLFSKNRLLYGLDHAREAIGKSRAAVVVEGYTDCIMAAQFGFENVLAVLGTALGERHVQVLRRFADSITLVLDGDEAGQKRTNEILEFFIAADVDLRIVTLPDALDPCDFLLERGAAAFAAAQAANVDALEHAFRVRTRGLDVRRQPHDARLALDELLTIIGKSPRLSSRSGASERIREWSMLSRLARWFEVDEAIVRERLTEIRRGNRRKSAADAEPITPATAEIGAWDRELLESMLLEPESVRAVAEAVRPEQLHSDAGRAIFAKACALAAEGIQPDFERLIVEFDEPHLKNLLVDLDEQGRAKLDDQGRTKGGALPAERLRDVLAGFHRRAEEQGVRDSARELKERRADPAEELNLLEQMIARERSRQGISSPMDG